MGHGFQDTRENEQNGQVDCQQYQLPPHAGDTTTTITTTTTRYPPAWECVMASGIHDRMNRRTKQIVNRTMQLNMHAVMLP